MVRATLVALGFLTRIPVPQAPVTQPELGRAVAAFPLAGLVLGGLLAGATWLLDGALPAPLVAVLLVALHAAATGGLHLDGVADLFDALGGGRGDRARTLAILRDSRIGAHGAVAVALVLAGKITAVAALVGPAAALVGAGVPAPALTGPGVPPATLLVLAACPAVARWAVVPLITAFPYARATGLGRAMHDHAGAREVVLATVLAAATLGTGALVVGRASGVASLAAVQSLLVPAAAAALVALAVGARLHARLGGLTGDVYGAAIELAELAFLVAACRR